MYEKLDQSLQKPKMGSQGLLNNFFAEKMMTGIIVITVILDGIHNVH